MSTAVPPPVFDTTLKIKKKGKKSTNKFNLYTYLSIIPSNYKKLSLMYLTAQTYKLSISNHVFHM